MRYGRRNFLRMGAGAWLASRLGAYADSVLPPLSVKEIRIEAGASASFTALHVSDSHLTLVNGDDAGDARKVKLANV